MDLEIDISNPTAEEDQSYCDSPLNDVSLEKPFSNSSSFKVSDSLIWLLDTEDIIKYAFMWSNFILHSIQNLSNSLTYMNRPIDLVFDGITLVNYILPEWTQYEFDFQTAIARSIGVMQQDVRGCLSSYKNDKPHPDPKYYIRLLWYLYHTVSIIKVFIGAILQYATQILQFIIWNYLHAVSSSKVVASIIDMKGVNPPKQELAKDVINTAELILVHIKLTAALQNATLQNFTPQNVFEVDDLNLMQLVRNYDMSPSALLLSFMKHASTKRILDEAISCFSQMHNDVPVAIYETVQKCTSFLLSPDIPDDVYSKSEKWFRITLSKRNTDPDLDIDYLLTEIKSGRASVCDNTCAKVADLLKKTVSSIENGLVPQPVLLFLARASNRYLIPSLSGDKDEINKPYSDIYDFSRKAFLSANTNRLLILKSIHALAMNIVRKTSNPDVTINSITTVIPPSLVSLDILKSQITLNSDAAYVELVKCLLNTWSDLISCLD